MGIDITVVLEIKNSDNKWKFVNTLDFDRNYLLFGYLAGVREKPKGYFEPRGLPIDASDETMDFFADNTDQLEWMDNYFCVSWVSKKEFENIVAKFKVLNEPNVEYLNSFNDEYRLVFGFVN